MQTLRFQCIEATALGPMTQRIIGISHLLKIKDNPKYLKTLNKTLDFDIIGS